MYLSDVLSVVEKTEYLDVCYYDPNMNEMRHIDDDNLNKYAEPYGRKRVKNMRPSNGKIEVQIENINT